MSYNEIGDYSGELFYTFDSFGNTSALTDSQGNVIVGYLYDLNNGAIKNEYNLQGIDNLFGFREGLSIENLTLASNGKDFIILNNYGAIRGNGNLAEITWAQPPGTSPLPLEFCPCPEFSLDTEREFSADEIKEAYENAGGGEAGIRAVSKLLFGDKLDSIPKGELDAIVSHLSSQGGLSIQILINRIEKKGGAQYIYFVGFGDPWYTGSSDVACEIFFAMSFEKLDPQYILQKIKDIRYEFDLENIDFAFIDTGPFRWWIKGGFLP